MTKEQLAEMLNGRPMGDELSREEEREAKANGLVVIFGYSDDNMEVRGAIRDECSCYEGGTFLISKKRVTSAGRPRMKGSEIKAQWCEVKPYSWTYETAIPHATFDILEDGEKFCRGIVFSISDLPA